MEQGEFLATTEQNLLSLAHFFCFSEIILLNNAAINETAIQTGQHIALQRPK